MKKRWFTLVEMMIVIIIVSILLALSLWISGGRVQILKNKSVQEQFTYTYNSLFSRNLLTNYYNWQLYDKMIIHLTLWENKFSYSYNNGDTELFSGYDNIQWGKYTIEMMHFSGKVASTQPNQSAEIRFTPYVLGCELWNNNQTWEILKVKLKLNDMEDYCVKINSDLCKLEKENCNN